MDAINYNVPAHIMQDLPKQTWKRPLEQLGNRIGVTTVARGWDQERAGNKAEK